MGQFSVEKPVLPGSALSGNQQNDVWPGWARTSPSAHVAFVATGATVIEAEPPKRQLRQVSDSYNLLIRRKSLSRRLRQCDRPKPYASLIGSIASATLSFDSWGRHFIKRMNEDSAKQIALGTISGHSFLSQPNDVQRAKAATVHT